MIWGWEFRSRCFILESYSVFSDPVSKASSTSENPEVPRAVFWFLRGVVVYSSLLGSPGVWVERLLEEPLHSGLPTFACSTC